MKDIEKILSFLSELATHNEKAWMDENRETYHEAKAAFEVIVAEIIAGLAQSDPSLRLVEAKSCIFRINRDVRFSKDKAPYKRNFSAFISAEGKKTAGAGYYLHIQPGNESFLASGIYTPAGEYLKKIRQEIDYNAGELKELTLADDFQKYFKDIQGEKLSRAPRGYSEDHPNIEFLKLKSYLVMHQLDDAALKASTVDALVKIFSASVPFNHYLNVAIS